MNNAYANYERTQHEEQYALVKVYKNFIIRYKNTACSNGRQRNASYFASEKSVLHNLWPWINAFKKKEALHLNRALEVDQTEYWVINFYKHQDFA